MEIIQFLFDIVGTMEVPFPIVFTILLALALYAKGQHISNTGEVKERLGIPKKNMYIGIIIMVLWQVASYLASASIFFIPTLIQYIIIGVVAGVTASGMSTLVHEIIKNKMKIKSMEEN